MHTRDTPSVFTQSVLIAVQAIPCGETRSYQEIATHAGSPRAARAVGTIMRNNLRLDVPCHRVIKSDGTLGSYNRGGIDVKRKLLTLEGALII